MRTLRRSLASVILTALLWTTPVQAAGYDTPILYGPTYGHGRNNDRVSPRRLSSIHTLLGWEHRAGNLIVDVSLLTGHLVANPAPLARVSTRGRPRVTPLLPPSSWSGARVDSLSG